MHCSIQFFLSLENVKFPMYKFIAHHRDDRTRENKTKLKTKSFSMFVFVQCALAQIQICSTKTFTSILTFYYVPFLLFCTQDKHDITSGSVCAPRILHRVASLLF